MKKSKKSYGSFEKDDSYGDELTLGEHIYHGFVKIKYYVMADESNPAKPGK